MATILKEKTVKIRKRRPCVGCRTVHDVGQQMMYVVSVDDGDIFANYLCLECFDYWNNIPSSEIEVVFIDQIGEMRKDELNP